MDIAAFESGFVLETHLFHVSSDQERRAGRYEQNDHCVLRSNGEFDFPTGLRAVAWDNGTALCVTIHCSTQTF